MLHYAYESVNWMLSHLWAVGVACVVAVCLPLVPLLRGK
jgi:hypothetical protein